MSVVCGRLQIKDCKEEVARVEVWNEAIFVFFLIPTFNKIIYSSETLKTLLHIAKDFCNSETFFFAYFDISWIILVCFQICCV